MKSLIPNLDKVYLFIILAIWLVPFGCLAQQVKTFDLDIDLNDNNAINQIINTQIQEQFAFSGLASYLNQVQYYIVDEEGIYGIHESNQTVTLEKDQWLAITGRFKALLIQSSGLEITLDDQYQVKLNTNQQNPQIVILGKSQLKQYALELDQIRYNHLWSPLATLAKLSEALLGFIKNTTALNWGMVILIFALFIKLLLLPVSIITAKSHKKVTAITRQLQPRLQHIKSKYDGEVAHKKIMQAHSDLGISPFYTLKPMLSFLIQIPVLIAIFNSLGEMPQLFGQSFLWINDLSRVDMVYPLGFNIPFMGDTLNLMPIIMTAITLLSAMFLKDNQASTSENKKQKIKMYLMALGFLVLFYPFPAAMVLYWTMANLLQFIQQKLFH